MKRLVSPLVVGIVAQAFLGALPSACPCREPAPQALHACCAGPALQESQSRCCASVLSAAPARPANRPSAAEPARPVVAEISFPFASLVASPSGESPAFVVLPPAILRL